MPAYRVRVSSRARHVRIQVSAAEGVIVVLPRAVNPASVPALLWKKKAWLDRTLSQFEGLQHQRPLATQNASPTFIYLRAINQQFQVTYHKAANLDLHLDTLGNQLLLQGHVTHDSLVRQTLQRWLTEQAHLHLPPWLETVSKEIGLKHLKTIIRGQRTRWASCSQRQTISLNHKLLFLPPHLVRYVFLHELVHLVHFNHSPCFWTLLTHFESNCRSLDQELRRAGHYVPAWAERR
ncbi:M48 family metallopeptidase [Nitrosococcus watsonii]|uniref:M48 family metallopeptidase n=1 Tax=Nitrosococcus watsonii TaxID=473531 RepID=UPI001E2BD8A4|nr:SprT family zinc-dependent metalloprotease [Nitrosococcus watsonii]